MCAGVEVHTYTVIYELIDEVRAAMEGELGYTEERVALGEAAVRAVFGSGSRKVAGCMVTEGLLKRDAVAEVNALASLLPCVIIAVGVHGDELRCACGDEPLSGSEGRPAGACMVGCADAHAAASWPSQNACVCNGANGRRAFACTCCGPQHLRKATLTGNQAPSCL